MTINQALEQWNIKEKDLLKMLSEGKIVNLKVENSRIILPDIPKPYKIPSNAKKNDSNIFKYILIAVKNNYYLDANVFGEKFSLTDEDFKNYTDELERCGMLKRKNNFTYSYSTLGFITAADKQEEINKIISHTGKQLISLIKKLNINIACVVL